MRMGKCLCAREWIDAKLPLFATYRLLWCIVLCKFFYHYTITSFFHCKMRLFYFSLMPSPLSLSPFHSPMCFFFQFRKSDERAYARAHFRLSTSFPSFVFLPSCVCVHFFLIFLFFIFLLTYHVNFFISSYLSSFRCEYTTIFLCVYIFFTCVLHLFALWIHSFCYSSLVAWMAKCKHLTQITWCRLGSLWPKKKERSQDLFKK